MRRRSVSAIGIGVIALLVATAAFAVSDDVSPTPFGIPSRGNPNPPANITAVRGDRQWYPNDQTRSEVLARHGVVATSQPLAAQAGLQMLKDGGDAADAAVATAAMLGLVEPESAGIGGDMEAIYYSAKDQQLYGLNAAGWAPASATPDFYHSKGLTHVPFYGVFSATVPGAVDGWSRFLNRFGRLSLAHTLQPSIEAASQGFGLTERIRGDWKSYDHFYIDKLKKDPESRKVFLQGDGKVPPLYSIFRNPDLAHAYRLLAEDGPDAFYRGPIGQAIVDRMNAGGAEWKMSDLSSFKSQWVDPISTQTGERRVGLAALLREAAARGALVSGQHTAPNVKHCTWLNQNNAIISSTSKRGQVGNNWKSWLKYSGRIKCDCTASANPIPSMTSHKGEDR
jgi:gamma-glutamyltranspeptidase/glutathione hydrolase